VRYFGAGDYRGHKAAVGICEQLDRDVTSSRDNSLKYAFTVLDRLAPGIPKESLWAYDDGGVNQIGCIYNAQGFEFDYVGVIFGPDLVYVPEAAEWKGDKTKSHDAVVKRSGDRFTQMVKNTYRVLLTRGMKGCYVYFMDKNTENFFRSRTERH
jgi:hypothetical protein